MPSIFKSAKVETEDFSQDLISSPISVGFLPNGIYYLLGSAVGAHPYPYLVRELQSVIGSEARQQMLDLAGALPDVAFACVGGGSNAIGLFYPLLADDIELIGVSSLATDHLVVPELMQQLERAGLKDIGVIVGGIVPDNERPCLLDAGVDQIFGPGAARDEIVARVFELVAHTRSARAA